LSLQKYVRNFFSILRKKQKCYVRRCEEDGKRKYDDDVVVVLFTKEKEN